ncbi:hypothetical protein F5051DRAFT_433250 [Lentinula edodes]|nr:hypothetical protein F5051DRAFT_433250 [Lentinula edodes]
MLQVCFGPTSTAKYPFLIMELNFMQRRANVIKKTPQEHCGEGTVAPHMLHVGVGNGGGEMAAASNAETEYIVPGLDRPHSVELDSNTQQEQCNKGTVAFHMVHVGMGDGGGEIHYTNKNARMTQGEDTRTLAPASISETEYIRLGDLDSPHAKDGESAVLFLAALQWKYTKVETVSVWLNLEEVADEMEKVVWNYFTTSSGVLWIQWNL